VRAVRGDDESVLRDSTEIAFYIVFESIKNNSRYVDELNEIDCIGTGHDKLTTKLAHLFDSSLTDSHPSFHVVLYYQFLFLFDL